MTRAELRVFLQDWFCGCDAPDAAARSLRDLLAVHPLFDHRKEFEAMVPDDGTRVLLCYTLAYFDLTEHGGTVGGAWLSDKGKAVLEALERESANDFEALCETACAHGYAVNDELDQCAECSKLNADAPDGSVRWIGNRLP